MSHVNPVNICTVLSTNFKVGLKILSLSNSTWESLVKTLFFTFNTSLQKDIRWKF